jgi:hypothetical protein
MYTINPSHDLVALTIVANFVEIWLAKEGHSGLVGLNLLEKIQLATLPSRLVRRGPKVAGENGRVVWDRQVLLAREPEQP